MAKMTRKDAVEMLKNRKVYVNGKSAEIQRKLFELGFKWNRGNQNVANEMSPFLFISDDMFIGCASSMIFFKKHKMVEISADEILSIEIIEPLKENDVVVCGFDNDDTRFICVVKNGNLNSYEYKVVLTKYKNSIGHMDFDGYVSTPKRMYTATEEDKKFLINALKASEYSQAKEILKEVFDIEEKPECTFKPFDRVLGRDTDESRWQIGLFAYCRYKDGKPLYYICLGQTWKQCIPFEGNEHLLGTTNSPEK